MANTTPDRNRNLAQDLLRSVEEHARRYPTTVTAERVMQSLAASIERDPNPQAYCKGATLSTSGTALLVDAPDGGQFIIEIRQVG
jgi:hypothetical protein